MPKDYRLGRKSMPRFTDTEVNYIRKIMSENKIKIKDIHNCMGLDRFQFGRIINKDPFKRRGLSDKKLFVSMFLSCLEGLKKSK
jgi:hypothetical protein